MDKNNSSNIVEEPVVLCNSKEISMVKTKFCGSFPLSKNRVSTRYFVVLSGECKLSINGEPATLHTSDIVVIPPNTAYKFSGDFETILIDTPAFSMENEENLEE